MSEEAKADLQRRADRLKAWAESMPPEWRHASTKNLTTIDQVAFVAEALSIMMGCVVERYQEAP